MRDTASFLGATGGRFGINNETTLGGGLFGELVNVSTGLSLAAYSLLLCGPQRCGQVRGLGGSGPIPIGAGVGATTGGDFDSPNGGTSNPCVAAPTPSNPDEGGSEQGTYIRCLGLGPTACAARCNAIGAYCVEYATHPKDPSKGVGALKQCMENFLSHTCTYCYSNGDVCTFIYAHFGIGVGDCTNTGGKGCE